jgi:hypothetical protein
MEHAALAQPGQALLGQDQQLQEHAGAGERRDQRTLLYFALLRWLLQAPAEGRPQDRPAVCTCPTLPPSLGFSMQAADSDQKVISKLMENDTTFMALTPEAAASQMPRLQAPLVTVSAEDPAVVVANLRRCEPRAHLSNPTRGQPPRKTPCGATTSMPDSGPHPCMH